MSATTATRTRNRTAPKAGTANNVAVPKDVLNESQWRRKLQWLEICILFVAGVAALASAVIAYQTSKKTIEFETEVSANETWSDYKDFGKLETDFTSGKYSYPTTDEDKNDRYALFVERLLMAADIVTFSLGNDPQWQDTFAYEFRTQKAYLLSDDFLSEDKGLMSEYCTYRKPVRFWIIDAFKFEPAAVKSKLTVAEKACVSNLTARGKPNA